MFFDSEFININSFIHKLVRQCHLILTDLKFFDNHILLKNKKRYDYSNVFNLEKFISLKSMCYLNSNLPMLVPPLN